MGTSTSSQSAELRQFKICVLGDSAVGKSSLIGAFSGQPAPSGNRVRSGAQVEVGAADSAAGPCQLVVWDILCADGGFALDTPYLVGMHGYVIVCDRTRRPTLSGARALRARVEEKFGSLPVVLAINKSDREADSEISAVEIDQLRTGDMSVFETSAMHGSNVTEVFSHLAAMLG